MAPNGGLQRLLDLCDEIRAIRQKIHDPGLKSETLVRLQARSREKLESLARELSECEFRGSLKKLSKGLAAEHFLILATLLRRYLRSQTPQVEGRALLGAVFESSYELLAGLELLQPEGRLRSAGLILCEGEHSDAATDLLESKFRLSDDVVAAFLEELGLRASLGTRGSTSGYRGQREYLIDLKLWHNLHRARARRLFAPEAWWRLRPGAGDRAVRAIERRIAQVERQIEHRLAKTPEAAQFALRQFIVEAGLDARELLIVLYLLFRELLEGNPYADVVQLVQLVSRTEEEVLLSRELFAENATLRRKDLVELEQMLEGRELTAEAHLSNWVVERVLGSQKQGPIDADERLNFHLYLKRLSSSNFLTDL